MAHKHTRSRPHADFRHRSQSPMPAVEEVEQRLVALLSPSLLAPRQMERRDPRQPQRVIRMRQRLLTLPVMVAIVVSLVWRRMPAVTEVQRVLAREGLLWVTPMRVSPQALIKRLDVLPAAVMGQLFAEVCARLQAQQSPALPHPGWAPVRDAFSLIALVDGSTLEALRKKTQVLRECQGLVLGGKMMVMVEAFSHRPLWQLYTADAAANDKRFGTEIMAALPVGGLLVFDLGFFSFLWLDDFTASHRFFVTRMREKIAYRTVQELSSGPSYRDEIIQMGQYRSHPCRYPVRMVSVLWQGVWYRYLTNVLDPQRLSARQVCELYRRRWRIEDAFALTKRVLDLSYLWTGSTNAVQLQIYATLIFYAVLLTLCQQVAEVLGEPLERISVEMVFRAFYHYSHAAQGGEADDLVRFLAEHAKLLGIVKRWRKHHRERQQLEYLIWEVP
jgi:Transposase DDE domain